MDTNSDAGITRLFAAADALLAAMHSVEGRKATVVMTLVKPTSSHRALAKAFTPDELIAAMDMLIRMGFGASDT